MAPVLIWRQHLFGKPRKDWPQDGDPGRCASKHCRDEPEFEALDPCFVGGHVECKIALDLSNVRFEFALKFG